MPEYAKAGWSVTKDEAQQSMNAGRVMWWTPRIDAIADRLEHAYSASESERLELAEEARVGALRHDADLLFREGWDPVLVEVADRIADTKRVTSVPVPECLRPTGVAA